jgi:hypothetical protein
MKLSLFVRSVSAVVLAALISIPGSNSRLAAQGDANQI